MVLVIGGVLPGAEVYQARLPPAPTMLSVCCSTFIDCKAAETIWAVTHGKWTASRFFVTMTYVLYCVVLRCRDSK